MDTIATDQPIPDGAIAALQQGQMIEAIKIVRMERGLGLKESKDELRKSSHKLGPWLALIVGAGLLAWLMLRPH